MSPYEKKIKTLERTIEQQEESMKNLKDRIEKNTKKAEIIYEKYTPLQRLLEIVKELKKKHEWKEIEQELKKEKRIRKVDLKDKKVLIDL